MEEELLCVVCKKKASISPSYTSGHYCEKHFRMLIEKRVRKDLRIIKAIQVKLPYYFEDDATPLSVFAKDILKSIFEDRLQFSTDSALPQEQHIFPACLEQCVANQFSDFLDQGDLGIHGVYPLRSVSIEDIRFLLPKADFSALKIDEFLSRLEEEQAGSHFAMANVFDVIKK